MGELMWVGGLDYLKSCNKHIRLKLSASWDAFLYTCILYWGLSNKVNVKFTILLSRETMFFSTMLGGSQVKKSSRYT